MRNIRTRLLVSFFAVIAVLLALSALLIVMHFTLIKQYQDVTNNMIDEYRITEVSTNLVNLFVPFTKSVSDTTLQAEYDSLHSEIADIFSRLDSAIVNKASRIAYIGLKNNVNTLVSGLDAGVAAVKEGNISDVGTEYDTALDQSYFVTENAGTLILDDLQYTEQVQANIAKNELWSEVLGGALFILTALGVTIYSILFSRRLIDPLGKLTKLAGNITGGNLDLVVDPKLLGEKDEVGILANSFDVMVRSLRSTIRELDAEKKGVEQKIVQRTHELQEQHAQLLASINSLPLGFLLLNTSGSVLLSNRTVQDLSPRKDLTLASLGGLLVPAFDISEFDRSMKERRSYELKEARLGEKEFRITATPVLLSEGAGGGTLIGSVILMEDITQERLLEQSKNSFLAIAAHEMRTPLTVIRGNTELLLGEPAVRDHAGFKTQIESILRSAVRLLDIVNDFLDIQNLESKKIPLKIEPVDIAALLSDTVNDLLTLAKEKGLVITLAVPPDFGARTLNMDAYRLQQIFTNIIGNAIHYTERGGVTVALREGDETIKILFEDTGIGISPEEQELLFKKFGTGRAFMRSREYGSGLGLYISRFLARMMGGDLVLEKSEVGKGSTFCLTLPKKSGGEAANAI